MKKRTFRTQACRTKLCPQAVLAAWSIYWAVGSSPLVTRRGRAAWVSGDKKRGPCPPVCPVRRQGSHHCPRGCGGRFRAQPEARSSFRGLQSTPTTAAAPPV